MASLGRARSFFISRINHGRLLKINKAGLSFAKEPIDSHSKSKENLNLNHAESVSSMFSKLFIGDSTIKVSPLPSSKALDCPSSILHEIIYKRQTFDFECPSGRAESDNMLPTQSKWKEVLEPEKVSNVDISCSSLLKKRKKKMNKHKYEKRRKRDRAKRRHVMVIRGRHKRRREAVKKRFLIEKLERIKEENPKSEYLTRSYVLYRLENW